MSQDGAASHRGAPPPAAGAGGEVLFIYLFKKDMN